MTYAYIILAHKNPIQLFRLVEQLQSKQESVDFYIHIDKNASILPFKEALIKFKSIYWLKQKKSKWGSFNLVQVVLDALLLQKKNHQKYTHTILLSGQDFPIKPVCDIEMFLQENIDKSFIDCQPLPVEKLNFGGYDRFERWHFYLGKYKFTYPLYKKKYGIKYRIASLLFSIFLTKKRTFSHQYQLYYGSQWWILSQNSIDYILSFAHKNKWFIDYFKYVWISDEHFFQTILLNHQDEKFKSLIVNDNFRYIDWDKPNTRLPAILQDEDYQSIKKSNKLFARKFDEEISQNLLKMIMLKIS